MTLPSLPKVCRLVASIALLSLPFLRAQAVSYGVNLLVNGDAEQGPYSTSGAPVTDIPGWTVTDAGFSVVNYGAPGGYPTNSQGPIGSDFRPNGGNQFFAGGNVALSSITQFIDISANAADIDLGTVTVDASGFLGGYLTDQDNATIYVAFRNGSAVTGTTLQLGPVSASDRSSRTGFVKVYASVYVPANTRQIEVNLVMRRVSGTTNDGYADNLSIALRKPYVVTNTNDSGPGSLRNAFATGNIITFDPTVFAVGPAAKVITLNSSLPTVTVDTTISGPGINALSIVGANNSASAFSAVGLGALAQPTLSISDLTANNAGCDSAHLNLTNVAITGGQVLGGNLVINDGTAQISNSSCSNNGGGGLSLSGSTVTCSDSTFSGNQGAGVAVGESTVALSGCTISGNTGDGVQVSGASLSSAVATLNNCTVSGNNGFGGVEADSYSSVSLDSCTIALNTGRSILADSRNTGPASVSLANTIVQATPFDTSLAFITLGGSSTITSRGYNLTNSNGGGYLTAGGDRLNTDAMLGLLQDNGGPTLTHALLAGSLAIDKGNSALPTDQRGAPRPVDDPNSASGGGNNSDIGAFEFQLPSQLLNLSTRKQVGTGDNVLIGGFIVAGTDSKNVIIRGLGPSLPASGKLADPTLELHDSTGALLAMNNNWKDTQQTTIQATGIPPGNDLEAALIYNLAAKPLANGGVAYTAILAGNGNTTGIGLLELYDLSQAANSQLVNISTRGLVGTGDDVLIGGFIPGPATASQVKVLVRALGPSLATSGVANVLQDPYLELHDGNGNTIATNDNWQDTQASDIQATGIPPTDPHESAILATLSASNSGYTAVVRGVNNSTGVGLVEFYALN